MEKSAKRKNLKSVLLFSPSILLIGIFFIGPMIMTVFFSFTNISLTGTAAQAMEFVGFRNFIEIFKDPKLTKVLINTMVFLVFSGIIGQQCLGFLMASLMKGKGRLIRKIVGFTVIAGWITPEVVASFMFSSFFADKGTLNKILDIFGASPISWLFTFPMACVIAANIWKGSAYSMMMFQASLDNISDDIVEAAKIDGANGFQILTRITIPMIKSTLATTFVVVTLGTLGTFGLVFALTGGGPGIATTTLSIFMYQKAFIAYQIGYGMAIALILLAVGIALSLLYMHLIHADTRADE
ncbi:MAG: sugar ABC transporter permease [Clostridiales bacterium]|nr:sugar ABC transporter permease [Clostridiales bacterium]